MSPLFCKQEREVLKGGTEVFQELCRRCAVNGSVVEGEGETHSRVNLAFSVQAVGGAAYAEDCGLRRIDNGSEAFNAHRAEVGDGEAAAGHFVGRELAFACLACESLRLSGEFCEGEGVGTEDNGNKETAVGVDCHADVRMLVLTEGIVDEVCVDFGIVRENTGNRIEDHIVDCDLGETERFAVCLELCTVCKNRRCNNRAAMGGL